VHRDLATPNEKCPVRDRAGHFAFRILDSESARLRSGLLLFLDQGDLGAELEINHGLNASIELEEASCGLARNNLIEDGNISLAKLIDLGIDIHRAFKHAKCLIVGHGAPVLRILLNQVIFRVVNFDEVGGVLIVDGPELSGLVGSKLKIGSNQLFFLGADVFAKKFDVLVDFLLLTSSGRLRGRGLCRGLGAGLRRRQEKGTGKKKCEDEFQFHGSSPLEFCEWSPAGGAGRRNQHFRK